MSNFDIFLDVAINTAIPEAWIFFTNLFFHWPSVVLIIIFLIIQLFKKQIRTITFKKNLFQNNNFDSNIQKIEIVKQPKQKNWSAIIAVVSLIALVWTVNWGIYLDKKYLPSERSEIIVTQPIIIPTDEGDELNQTFKNIGKVTANNINFKIYSIVVDKDIIGKLKNYNLKILSKQFDSKIIHDLPPDTEATVGKILQSYNDKINAQLIDLETQKVIEKIEIDQLELKNKKTALIYHLEYYDDLDSKKQNRFFLFQYNIGLSNLPSKMLALIYEDYSIIYCELKNELKKEKQESIKLDKKYNDALLNFIEDNPPKEGVNSCG